MGTVPSLVSFIAGERPTAAKLNANTVTAYNFVANRPVCQIFNGAAQSFINSSTNNVTMPSVGFDTDSMADVANNRIVIKTAGLYKVTAQVAWASNATGYRFAAMAKGGAGFATETTANAGAAATRVNFVGYVRCLVNDNLSLQCAQNSGGSLNSDPTLGGCFLVAEWIAA